MSNQILSEENEKKFRDWYKQAWRLMSGYSESVKPLIIVGPQGSGKTTLARWLTEAISDRNVAQIVSLGKGAFQEMLIASGKGMPILFDNVLKVPEPIRDLAINITSGSNLNMMRSLRGQGDYVAESARAVPIVITCVVNTSPGEFTDRSMVIELPSLQGKYLEEREVSDYYNDLVSDILAEPLEQLTEGRERKVTTIEQLKEARTIRHIPTGEVWNVLHATSNSVVVIRSLEIKHSAEDFEVVD